MDLRRMSFDAVRIAMRRRGYTIYKRPYELNIVGVRSPSTVPNSFDDFILVFYQDNNGRWVNHAYPATTDPGTYWLNQPMMPQGTAILIEGQYKDTYEIGMHRNKYLALVQRLKMVSVWRDYDRDAVLDFNNGTTYTGWFGINIHHASSNGTTKTVDKYSGGCQVFANIEDFNSFMAMCEAHRALYGNVFTYTLIDLRAVQRTTRRNITFAIGGLLGFIMLLVFVLSEEETKHENKTG
jgi:hypothetical protein